MSLGSVEAAAQISNADQLASGISALAALPTDSIASSVASLLSNIVPSATQTDIAQATSALSSIYAAAPTGTVSQAAGILLNGLAEGALTNILDEVLGYPCVGSDNSNPDPPSAVYPSKSTDDAPFDIPETTLRSALNIPSAFQYGKDGKTPIIFIPGTGVTGCETYTPQYAKVLSGSSYADPVFLNVPTRMLDDEANNAEFIAYAINYISSISGGANVSIAAYSGGNTATQWALKYWPSTRSVVSHYLAFSPDYHGTVLDVELCPLGTLCAPSVMQQEYNSIFVQTLLNNGGNSSYVPTTISTSIFDENVEPQSGTGASAYLDDIHGAGVLHNEIQQTCGALTAAGFPLPGHEGTLYNGEVFAVNLDALQNTGAGDLVRAKASDSCGNLVGPGLDLNAFLGTELLQPIALVNVVTYPVKLLREPEIKAYAQKDIPADLEKTIL